MVNVLLPVYVAASEVHGLGLDDPLARQEHAAMTADPESS